jgi:hypothetical protein
MRLSTFCGLRRDKEQLWRNIFSNNSHSTLDMPLKSKELGRELFQVSTDKNSTLQDKTSLSGANKGLVLFCIISSTVQYSTWRTWSTPCHGGCRRLLIEMVIPLITRLYYVYVYIYMFQDITKINFMCFLCFNCVFCIRPPIILAQTVFLALPSKELRGGDRKQMVNTIK